MNNKDLANLIFPDIDKDINYYLEKYSSRDLELEIKKVDALGNETNLISEFSLEDDIFFKLDKNGCIIKFTSDVGVMNKILFTPYIYKKVV